MRSRTKEAIRNQITSYAGMAWDTKRVYDMHPLVHLMIDDLCNELFLMENKLHDLDTAILDKLVLNLAPRHFNYVRAGMAIVQARPQQNKVILSRMTELLMKEMPDYLQRKNLEKAAFSPVTDVQLNNLGISHMYYNRKSWNNGELADKKTDAQANQHCIGNKIWFQIDNPGGVKQVKDLSFYIDFPHLDDNHPYYQALSQAKWKLGDVPLEMEEGLPPVSKIPPNEMESEVLSYYSIHYRTAKGILALDEKSYRQTPYELALVLGMGKAGKLPGGHWVSIELPTHFKAEDLEKIKILLNAFPVINRRQVKLCQSAKTFTGQLALSSNLGEEFLELEHVDDTDNNSYVPGDTGDKSKQGTYSLEVVKKKNSDGSHLRDYLELFMDVLDRERAVFPKLNMDEITKVQDAIASLQEVNGKKVDLNLLKGGAEAAHLTVNLNEDAHALNVSYWTTLAELANGIPANTGLMASQTEVLSKSETTLVTAVTGGRTFFDMESLRAVNRFYMTSKGRILTKHDMLGFCRIELGKFAKSIDAVRCGKISTKQGEGIVNAIEIRITPKEGCRDYFKRKEVSRWLKMRLEERSPIHYNYVITIIEP